MNTNEREMLTQLLQQMTLAEVAQKDMEADALIREACLKQPDAAYLLVQRVMLLEIALQQSQAQIVRLQGELDQVRDQTRTDSSGCFLDPNAWGSSALMRINLALQTQSSPALPVPVPVPTPAHTDAVVPAGAWGSGMLGSMATTAAGVVAGGLLFQGIERWRGSHSANSGLMDGLGQAAADPHGTTAFNPPVGSDDTNADLLGASSVDDFIANEIDSNP